MITFDTFYTIQRVSGLSQDDKPMGMKPGSIFMELDTGKKFIFDGETWHEQPQGGGGLPVELESVTEYTHAEDWTSHALGNTMNFAETYCNKSDTSDRRLYVCYVTNNMAAQSYRANFLCFQRNGAAGGDFISNNVRDNWNNTGGGLIDSRSFYLTAGSIVKVFVFKFGGIA